MRIRSPRQRRPVPGVWLPVRIPARGAARNSRCGMKPERVETVAEKQARFNRSTRTHWLHFATHRARVQELILTGRPLARHGNFIALGAGNFNDLDLPRLLDAFE